MRLRPADRAPVGVCAWWGFLALSLLTAAAVRAQEPRGTLIVANKAEATVSLIDLASGRAVATLPTGEGPHEVAVSPSGRWAVVSNYGGDTPGTTLTVLDLLHGRVARTVSLGEHRRPHGLAWTADGRRLLVTSQVDSSVLVLDAVAWRVERTIRTNQQTSHMVALSPDGRFAYVGNVGSGTVTQLDVRRGVALRTTPTGAGAEGIAVSPDGREVWVADRAANTVGVLDAATLRFEDTLPSADFPIRVRFTPDGRQVLVSNARSGEVRLFDVASRRVLASIHIPYDSSRASLTMLGAQFAGSALPIGVLVTPGGHRAYVAASAMREVLELDLRTQAITRHIPTGREPDGLGFSPISIPR